MLKITSGRFRGRTVKVPAVKSVRPTTALVRESIFNRLGQTIQDARFLELYAGSGLMGLEALSRGAAFVCAVEMNGQCCQTILENYERFGLEKIQARLIQRRVEALLEKPWPEEPFDIVFLDPPYQQCLQKRHLGLLLEQHWIHPETLIIYEHGRQLAPMLASWQQVTFGETMLSIGTWAELI